MKTGSANGIGLCCIVAISLVVVSAHAQESEPRMPQGIQGLDEGQARPPSANWLLDAVSDEERFRRIQIYAGGTYEQMWQIGYRYEQVYHAIVDENWQLGLHHWGKLRDVFNVALMKRPNRTPNAEAMFLNETWGSLEAALQSGQAEAARRTFLQQREICIACHVAEEMAFLNDSPLFRDTAGFPPE
jgi:hypothetical protein